MTLRLWSYAWAVFVAYPQVKFSMKGGKNHMSQELDEARERGRITTLGFEYIKQRLGYGGNRRLSLETNEGKRLAYDMGLLISLGNDREDLGEPADLLLDHLRMGYTNVEIYGNNR